jgi:hypothetical protein
MLGSTFNQVNGTYHFFDPYKKFEIHVEGGTCVAVDMCGTYLQLRI